MDQHQTRHQALLGQLTDTAALPFAAATALPPGLYRNTDIADTEQARIFRSGWLCAGLAAEIPEAGDYLTFSIADEPVFCLRNQDREIRSFSNVCRHRMMKLLESKGRARRIICPYHAWTYNMDGQLIGAGHMDRSEGFDKSAICLPEIRTEVWNGWIYVTLNPDAAPLSGVLSPLDDVVSRYDMANYVPVLSQDHVWQTNWKLLCENFMESYHLPIAHKTTVGAWLPVDETRFPDQVFDAFTYQTFRKNSDATYGLAHPDNQTLEGIWRSTSVMPTVFPCHMYVLAPDHLWYLTLRPKGVGEVKVRFGVAIAPEVLAGINDPDAWLAELTLFFDQVNAEDRAVVEGIFAGSKSEFAIAGRLSWLERSIHDFQKYLAGCLTDPPGGGDR